MLAAAAAVAKAWDLLVGDHAGASCPSPRGVLGHWEVVAYKVSIGDGIGWNHHPAIVRKQLLSGHGTSSHRALQQP